jgi:hypothetical protein
LNLDARPAAGHVAGILELGDDRLHSVGWDVEPGLKAACRSTSADGIAKAGCARDNASCTL